MSLLEEIRGIKIEQKELRSFSLLIGVVLIIFSLTVMQKTQAHFMVLIMLASSILVLGLFAPFHLKHFYRYWMSLALITGGVMTRVILTIFYYIFLILISLLGKLSGESFLAIKWNQKPTTTSYWISKCKPDNDLSKYKKQY